MAGLGSGTRDELRIRFFVVIVFDVRLVILVTVGAEERASFNLQWFHGRLHRFFLLSLGF
jgi:hypothetical protein